MIRDLVRADRLVNSYFEPGQNSGVSRNDRGEVTIDGNVILKVDRSVNRMESFRMSTGEQSDQWYFREPTYEPQLSQKLRGRYFKYPVRGALPASAGAMTVRLELEDGSDDGIRRSFTFVLPDNSGD